MSICNSYFPASESPERETYAFITHISEVDGFIFKCDFLPHSLTQIHYANRPTGHNSPFPKMHSNICPGLGDNPPEPHAPMTCQMCSLFISRLKLCCGSPFIHL